MDIIETDTANQACEADTSTGYLCESVEEYAAAMADALDNYDYRGGAKGRGGASRGNESDRSNNSLRQRARDSAVRFSDDSFKLGFERVFRDVFVKEGGL